MASLRAKVKNFSILAKNYWKREIELLPYGATNIFWMIVETATGGAL